jgi:hypothetical protein
MEQNKSRIDAERSACLIFCHSQFFPILFPALHMLCEQQRFCLSIVSSAAKSLFVIPVVIRKKIPGYSQNEKNGN